MVKSPARGGAGLSKQLKAKDYFDLSRDAAFVHNGTPLASIEQELGSRSNGGDGARTGSFE
jgi:hypothetical protein